MTLVNSWIDFLYLFFLTTTKIHCTLYLIIFKKCFEISLDELKKQLEMRRKQKAVHGKITMNIKCMFIIVTMCILKLSPVFRMVSRIWSERI